MKSNINLPLILFALCLITACKKDNNDFSIVINQSTTAGYTVTLSTQTSSSGTYSWDFGDGSATSNEANPTHAYACPGEYTVKLTVTVDGKTSTENQNITIQPITFKKKFSSSSSLFPATVVRTADKGYAVFGSNQTDPLNLFYFLKTDALGKKVWDKTYASNTNIVGSSMCRTADGGYALFGIKDQLNNFTTDLYLLKIDSLGNKLWDKTYGGNLRESPGSILQTADGGFAISGSTSDSIVGTSNFYLIKTDALGQVQWEHSYGGPGDQSGSSLVITPDGGYAMLGTTNETSAQKYDFYLVKANASGTLEWEKTFGDEYDNVGTSLENAPDGGFVLLGSSQQPGGFIANDVYLIKTNQFGEKEWDNRFILPGNEGGSSIKRTAEGGYIILGYTNGIGAGNFDILLFKTDKSGQIEWAKTFGESTYDVGSSIEQVSDCDGYIITGLQFFQIGLIKTDKDGNAQ